MRALLVAWILAGCGSDPSDDSKPADADTDADTDADVDTDLPPNAVLYDLAVTGTGFEAYEGLPIVVRVADTADGGVVGGGMILASGGGFEEDFPALLADGHAYEVAALGDVNPIDGKCSADAEDTWSTTLAAATGPTAATLDADADEDPAACALFPPADPRPLPGSLTPR